MTTLYKYSCCFVALAAICSNGLAILGRRFGRPSPPDDDANRNADTSQDSPFDAMAGLVQPYGYYLEEHFVETTDGYILRIFRIGPKEGCDPNRNSDSLEADDDEDVNPNANPRTSTCSGLNSSVKPKQPIVDTTRPVVLMQHPLMGSSVDYVVMGPGRSLGFILVDSGYDVWLTNVRGNRFSRNHTRLNPDASGDQDAFWAFSWDEHVALDLPAVIDYIAAATGHEQILYVGYSQGTTIGLAALASQPRVTRRVAAAVLLAPVAFVSHMTSPIFRFMSIWRLEQAFNWLGWHEYAPHIPWASEYAAKFCGRYPGPCKQYLFLLCGANPRGNLDTALMPEIMRFLPSGTSVQNMAHWGQLVRSNDPARLSYFDYGTSCSPTSGDTGAVRGGPRTGGRYPCNQAAYNSTTPPAYALRGITTPLALFTGGHDSLSDPWDVKWLLDELGANGAVKLHHDEPDYGHLDFGVGRDAADRIYPIVMDFITKYTPGPPAGIPM